MKKQIFAALVFFLVYTTSCSHLVIHSNAGIPFLEESSTPVKVTSMGAKYLGWGLSTPLVAAMTPIAAIAWSTPWIDLTTAIDIASAPAIGMGYTMEGAIGLPSLAALFWMDKPAIEKQKLSIPKKTLIPWGFIVDHKKCATPSRGALSLPTSIRNYYSFSKKSVHHLQQSLSSALNKKNISIPLNYGLPATLHIYLAKKSSAPLILMTPPTKASFAAHYLAKRYSWLGFHAAVIVPNKTFLEPHLAPREIEEKFRNAVITARIVLKTLRTQKQIKHKNIYYLGVSAGGIFGAILLAVEPVIQKAALILPGCDFPHIIAHSNESSVSAYRKAWEKKGVSSRDLAKNFERCVHTDPKKLSQYVNPRRVLIFLGASDTKVPIKTGLALRQALGYPETYLLAGSHETAALCFGFILRQTEKFFFTK